MGRATVPRLPQVHTFGVDLVPRQTGLVVAFSAHNSKNEDIPSFDSSTKQNKTKTETFSDEKRDFIPQPIL